MQCPLTVAFDSGHLCERGTDVALYDYARYAEELLGHRSLIFCPADAPMTELDRFRARFSVVLYRSRNELQALLDNVDVYYLLVEGSRPQPEAPKPRNGHRAVHCVFRADQPWGEVYASVSPWVSRHHGDGDVPAVPHIVTLPDHDDDLRTELGIPADATVLGRHGGFDTFNIPWAADCVRRAVRARDDLHFVFLNTRPFDEHERVHWLPRNSDPDYKTSFINSCDAMIHARAEGETFGLSVAEFSIRNKPIITCLEGLDLYHVEVLQQTGIYYRTREDLDRILACFRPIQGNFDRYSATFSPEAVMKRFEEVLLRPALQIA